MLHQEKYSDMLFSLGEAYNFLKNTNVYIYIYIYIYIYTPRKVVTGLDY